MSAQHTPGPWAVDAGPHDARGRRHLCIRPGQTGWLIASLRDEPGWGEGDPSQRAEANARLIAAAPDLLAACIEALGMLPDCDNAHADVVMALIEAAIAKAEGREVTHGA